MIACARCGAKPPHGLASIWMPGQKQRHYCHPDEEWLPDCYSLASHSLTFPEWGGGTP